MNGRGDFRRGRHSTKDSARRARAVSHMKDAVNKDIEVLYTSLYLAMEQEYQRYQELLEAIEDGTSTLISCTPAELIDFNSRNERLLLSVNMASDIRLKAIKEIASFLRLDEPVTMEQLIFYAPGRARQNLMDYKEKFADLIRKLHLANSHHRALIEASLSYINNTLNYIANLTCFNPSYDRYGQVGAGNLQSRLISEAG